MTYPETYLAEVIRLEEELAATRRYNTELIKTLEIALPQIQLGEAKSMVISALKLKWETLI